MLTASFGLKNNSNDWSLTFGAPSSTLVTSRIEEVVPLLDAAEAAAQSGSYVALMLSYEAAQAFDPAFKTATLNSFPLAWAAIFAETITFPNKRHCGTLCE